MKRRNFLVLGSLLGLSSFLEAKTLSKFNSSFEKVKPTIFAVQEHMFPQGSKIPSASSMQVTEFLFETISHKSYDKEMRVFIIEGAERLMKREGKKFTSMNAKNREKALRAYEETSLGSHWLFHIMTITMEGMFCDPIYGSNIKELGWKALDSYGGMPRPTSSYILL